MILAEKIIEERKKNGWTQEDLAERLDVSRQSVSKWESGQSIPDLNRILQMSDLFGVSTDYLLKDDFESGEFVPKPKEDEGAKVGYRKVSMEEAIEYMELREKNAFRIALGIALMFLSPVTLMVLLAFFGTGKDFAIIAGIFTLFIFISIALVLFIMSDNEGKPFDYMTKERIETAYGVRGMVKEKEREFAPKYSLGFSMGFVICILSPLPTIAGAIKNVDDSLLIFLSSTILMLSAFGMFLVIKFSIIKETYSILLKEGEYSDFERESTEKIDKYAPIYWCGVTFIYLAYSLTTQKWATSLIIWALSGVLWAFIANIIKAKN